ncbi:unnamed protein product [Zymoseptoria tritici ST99CH_3D7]|uniref:Uncharacterized protein n=1 Tax=Zymoseptoria tritici (strain ST99CH_3D7) TaxID=1276538 RepID=A0A1X7RUZ0_ZYMT9|nr:unnamed protein product [Zymoseptoria tritici ST99CH_3D7]
MSSTSTGATSPGQTSPATGLANLQASQTTSSTSSATISPTGGNENAAPLSESEKETLNDLSQSLPAANEDGKIVIETTPEPVKPEMAIEPQPFNPDPAHQAQLQDAMAADGLATPEQVVEQAIESLAEAETSNVEAGGPAQLAPSIENQNKGDAYWSSLEEAKTVSKRDLSAAAGAAPEDSITSRDSYMMAADSNGAQLRQLNKRAFGWDILLSLLGSDFISSICPACGNVSGDSFADVVMCLMGGPCQSPPAATINTLSGTSSQEFSFTEKWLPGKIYGDSQATIAIADEGVSLAVTSLKIEGKVSVTPSQVGHPDNFLESSNVTVTQSMVSTALFNIRLNEATAGSFDIASSTLDAASFSVPNVFSLSAKFLWGYGMT